MQFPQVSSSNLERQKFQLPSDFAGEMNLVFIAFQQHQQLDVDTWLPLAKLLVDQYPTLNYYELPTIRSMNFISRSFIDGGMRAGIPDPAARAATITLYIDKKQFRNALNLPDENRIYVLLVDQTGEVVWMENGRFSTEKANDLQQTLNDLIFTETENSVILKTRL